MDYPVLGHYDPAVDASVESGGDEQELLCECFSSFNILSLSRERRKTRPVNTHLIDQRFDVSERREISPHPYIHCSHHGARSGVLLPDLNISNILHDKL